MALRPETLEAEYQRLADALQRDSNALSQGDRTELARLFVYEARKGAFRSQGTNDRELTLAFAQHVAKEFGRGSGVEVVYDYQWRLLGQARALARREHPIEALILYATWLEHWINGVLICGLLSQGGEPQTAIPKIKAADFPRKLGPLWEELALPPLEEEWTGKIGVITKARNDFVHYKWEGRSQADVAAGNDPIALALDGVEGILRSLWAWTLDEFDRPHIEVAERLFQTPLRSYLMGIFDEAAA